MFGEKLYLEKVEGMLAYHPTDVGKYAVFKFCLMEKLLELTSLIQH